jgi:hypothetical protein
MRTYTVEVEALDPMSMSLELLTCSLVARSQAQAVEEVTWIAEDEGYEQVDVVRVYCD